MMVNRYKIPRTAAKKTRQIGIAVGRAAKAVTNDIFDKLSDAYFDQGMDFSDAWDSVKDDFTAEAIERFGAKIRAALSRAGLEFAEGVPLTIDAIKAAVIEKVGLDIDDLTTENIIGALDANMAARLSDATGLELTTVASGVGLGDMVRAGIKDALENGRAEKIMTGSLSMVARKDVTWKRRGFDAEKRKRAMNALYQKRYRRKNKQVWV